MLRIAVVEDNLQDAESLRACLKRFASEQNIVFHIDLFKNGLAFLEAFHADYNIVFMDIELPHKNGMETAQELRQLDQQVVLVFVTNMAQYAIEGYEVDAFDYILKPISYFDLFLKLQRIVARAVGQGQNEEIAIRCERTTIRLNLRAIQYIDVNGHYVNWHTQAGIFHSLDALKAVEKRLPEYYCSISRWVIVNLNYVESIDGNDVYIGDIVLHISRYRKQEFLKTFAEYLVGKVQR